MRRITPALFSLLLPFALYAAEPEQWKGKPYDTRFQLGALGGVGTFGAGTGFGLLGTAAFKILHTGFIEDINDQGYIELTGGPLFMSGGTGTIWSLHLRWDFHKNELWSFYAVGGLGMGSNGALTMFYPRVAIGTFWNLFEFLSFRLEMSHEFTGLGITYLL